MQDLHIIRWNYTCVDMETSTIQGYTLKIIYKDNVRQVHMCSSMVTIDYHMNMTLSYVHQNEQFYLDSRL